MINRLFSTLALVALTFASAHAQDARSFFALTGTDIGATNCHAILPANGIKPFGKVQYFNVTSDKAGSLLKFHTVGTGITIHSAAAAGGTNIPANGTGNFTDDTAIILRSVANDTYERLFISSLSATNIVTTGNTVNAMAVGDIVYPITEVASGTIPVGNATKEINAQGAAVWMSQRNRPIYVELDGTSAVQINVISGSYSD